MVECDPTGTLQVLITVLSTCGQAPKRRLDISSVIDSVYAANCQDDCTCGPARVTCIAKRKGLNSENKTLSKNGHTPPEGVRSSLHALGPTVGVNYILGAFGMDFLWMQLLSFGRQSTVAIGGTVSFTDGLAYYLASSLPDACGPLGLLECCWYPC